MPYHECVFHYVGKDEFPVYSCAQAQNVSYSSAWTVELLYVGAEPLSGNVQRAITCSSDQSQDTKTERLDFSLRIE